jgi:hypothetical protein
MFPSSCASPGLVNFEKQKKELIALLQKESELSVCNMKVDLSSGIHWLTPMFPSSYA